jgi:hypothetical protein
LWRGTASSDQLALAAGAKLRRPGGGALLIERNHLAPGPHLRFERFDVAGQFLPFRLQRGQFELERAGVGRIDTEVLGLEAEYVLFVPGDLVAALVGLPLEVGHTLGEHFDQRGPHVANVSVLDFTHDAFGEVGLSAFIRDANLVEVFVLFDHPGTDPAHQRCGFVANGPSGFLGKFPIRVAFDRVDQLEIDHHFGHRVHAANVPFESGAKEARKLAGGGGLPQVHQHRMVAPFDDGARPVGAFEPMAADRQTAGHQTKGDEEGPATQGQNAQSLDDVVAQIGERGVFQRTRIAPIGRQRWFHR